MTALSANASYDIRNVLGQKEETITIKTSSVIYKHALVVVDDAGNECLPAANATTTQFMGLAKTGPLTGDGTVQCTFVYDIDVKLPSTGLSQGNIGVNVYCSDDALACLTTTLGPVIGTMVGYDATNSIWVHLRGPAFAKAS